MSEAESGCLGHLPGMISDCSISLALARSLQLSFYAESCVVATSRVAPSKMAFSSYTLLKNYSKASFSGNSLRVCVISLRLNTLSDSSTSDAYA